MDIGMVAIIIGIVVAAYNLIINLHANKKQNNRGNKNILKAIGKSLLLGIVAYLVVINIDLTTDENTPVEYEIVSESEAENAAEYEYTFRNEQLLMEHFEKHGIYMKYKNPEQYLRGANRVIDDSDTLHAVEAEDGDDVYYLERTNEFVVVSTDGYIRTYFCPEDGIDYFHRQSEN